MHSEQTSGEIRLHLARIFKQLKRFAHFWGAPMGCRQDVSHETKTIDFDSATDIGQHFTGSL